MTGQRRQAGSTPRRNLTANLLTVASLAAVMLAAAARSAPAQDTGLSKSELVRLLVSRADDDEKIATVRARCLSFEPTEGDWTDLRGLGADEEFISAARECARAAQVTRVTLSASRITARAGDTTGVTVSLARGGSPLSGAALTISGSDGMGNAYRQSGSTNSRGRAYFPIPAGTAPGTARYAIVSPGTALEGPTRLTVTTVVGEPFEATIDPATLSLREGDAAPDLRVSVRDEFGNPVPAANLILASGPGSAAAVLATAKTDNSGTAMLSLRDDWLPAGSATWELRSGDAVLGRLPITIAEARPVAPPPVVVAADPVEEAIRDGNARLEEGNPVAAEASFREALRLSPRRRDAQMGLAAALVARGEADDAITWYELVTQQYPEDVEAWEGLGQAYAAAGRRGDAAFALARARELDPTREELSTEIADLGRPPGHFEGYAWGGSTNDNSESGGLRGAGLDVSLTPRASLHAGFDRSLAPSYPELIRGPDEWDTWFAGGSLSWGTAHRFETAFDAGQRKQGFGDVADGSKLTQNIYRLTQHIRLSGDRRGATISVGGFLGRWFDRDDWIVYGRLSAPVGRELSVVGSVSYGETIGTNWIETGRHADTDGRGYLGLAWENAKGFSVQPLVGVGSVSSERSEDLSGTLLDFLVEGGVPIGSSAGLRLFVRHQRPPGSDPFTVFAAGLALKVGWAGG